MIMCKVFEKCFGYSFPHIDLFSSLMQFFVQTPVQSKLESLIVSLILAMRTPAPRSTSVSPVDVVVAPTPVNKTYEGKADFKEYNCSGIFNV